MTRSQVGHEGKPGRFFTEFSNFVAKWTGSHWTFTVAGGLAIISLVVLGIEKTSIMISIVTLLMVFVLQNTQNRDSAALHLKLDEIVRVDPHARDAVRGVESKSEHEIRELSREDAETVSAATQVAEQSR